MSDQFKRRPNERSDNSDNDYEECNDFQEHHYTVPNQSNKNEADENDDWDALSDPEYYDEQPTPTMKKLDMSSQGDKQNTKERNYYSGQVRENREGGQGSYGGYKDRDKRYSKGGKGQREGGYYNKKREGGGGGYSKNYYHSASDGKWEHDLAGSTPSASKFNNENKYSKGDYGEKRGGQYEKSYQNRGKGNFSKKFDYDNSNSGGGSGYTKKINFTNDKKTFDLEKARSNENVLLNMKNTNKEYELRPMKTYSSNLSNTGVETKTETRFMGTSSSQGQVKDQINVSTSANNLSTAQSWRRQVIEDKPVSFFNSKKEETTTSPSVQEQQMPTQTLAPEVKPFNEDSSHNLQQSYNKSYNKTEQTAENSSKPVELKTAFDSYNYEQRTGSSNNYYENKGNKFQKYTSYDGTYKDDAEKEGKKYEPGFQKYNTYDKYKNSNYDGYEGGGYYSKTGGSYEKGYGKYEKGYDKGYEKGYDKGYDKGGRKYYNEGGRKYDNPRYTDTVTVVKLESVETPSSKVPEAAKESITSSIHSSLSASNSSQQQSKTQIKSFLFEQENSSNTANLAKLSLNLSSKGEKEIAKPNILQANSQQTSAPSLGITYQSESYDTNKVTYQANSQLSQSTPSFTQQQSQSYNLQQQQYNQTQTQQQSQSYNQQFNNMQQPQQQTSQPTFSSQQQYMTIQGNTLSNTNTPNDYNNLQGQEYYNSYPDYNNSLNYQQQQMYMNQYNQGSNNLPNSGYSQMPQYGYVQTNNYSGQSTTYNNYNYISPNNPNNQAMYNSNSGANRFGQYYNMQQPQQSTPQYNNYQNYYNQQQFYNMNLTNQISDPGLTDNLNLAAKEYVPKKKEETNYNKFDSGGSSMTYTPQAPIQFNQPVKNTNLYYQTSSGSQK